MCAEGDVCMMGAPPCTDPAGMMCACARGPGGRDVRMCGMNGGGGGAPGGGGMCTAGAVCMMGAPPCTDAAGMMCACARGPGGRDVRMCGMNGGGGGAPGGGGMCTAGGMCGAGAPPCTDAAGMMCMCRMLGGMRRWACGGGAGGARGGGGAGGA
jgi:hypothetical protein